MSTIADRLKNLYDSMVIANSVTNEFTQALPDCYDAVEEKGGTIPAQQTAANLPTAISSIPGQGFVEPEEKDVLFIDYDGTILFSYTYAELENVTALPTADELPIQHDGLTFAGWTNTLQELKTYKKKISLCGALYTPTDSNQHFFIKTLEANQTFTFNVGAISALSGTTATIYWGDGQSSAASSNTSPSHTYVNAGSYEIKMSFYASGMTVTDTSSLPLLLEVWLSGTSYYSSYATWTSYGASNLRKIVPPIGQPFPSGNDALNGCSNLQAIVKSGSIAGAHRSLIYSGIKYLIPWGDLSGNNNSWGASCFCLKRTNFPVSPSSTGQNTNLFESDYNLQYIWLNPNAAVSSLKYCRSLRELHIPHTSVPSLANANYFTEVPKTCRIYVKRGLLSSYETATNWSTIYAQYTFVEED